jgi:dihydroorotate dehydrogenase
MQRLWAQRLRCLQLNRRFVHDAPQSGSIYESSLWTRGRMALSILVLGSSSIFGLVYLMDSRAAIHTKLLMPLMHAVLEPEDSHNVAIWLAKHGLVPKQTTQDDPVLETQIWGKVLQNPVGLAAGFDKNAEAIDGLLGFGFGSVEIGSVTPQPQAGNALPRMFRLPADGAVINRYGFNSQGHEQVKGHLLSRIHAFMRRNLFDSSEYPHYNGDQQLVFDLPKDTPRSLTQDRLLGVNLGKNKVSAAESNEDYVRGIKDLGVFADYLVVNVSSPNTPGLRSLQRREPMEKLMREVRSSFTL